MATYALQREIGLDPRDFGVVADGATDDSAAFAALAAGHYMLSAATYKIGANCTVPVGVHLTMMPGAVFDIGTGFTLTINGAFEAPPLQVFDGDGSVLFTTSSPIPEVSILWWGAVADSGTTDCRAAIIACISSLHDRGGTVFVPSGRGGYYGVTDVMWFLADSGYSNLTVRGEGHGSWIKHTVDKTGSNQNGILFFQGANIYELKNIRVEHLRISGNSANDLTQILSIDNVDGVVIDDLYFDSNGCEGIYINSPQKCKNVWVVNCYGEDIGTTYFNGLSALNLNAINVHCHNNTLYNVGQFLEHAGIGLNVSGNLFKQAANYGLLVMSTWSGWFDADGVEQNSQLATITNNIIEDCPVGILFGDAGGRTVGADTFSGNLGKVIIANNIFRKCTQCVNVGMDGDNPCVISDNLFMDARNATGAAIVLSTGTFVVRGNTFFPGPTSQWAYLIRADTVDTDSLIEGNTAIGMSWSSLPFWFGGTKFTLRENVFLPHGDTFASSAKFLRIGGENGFQEIFFNDDVFTATKPVTYSGQQRSEWYGFAVPDVFTWKVGDKIENSAAASAGYLEWLCTVAGTAGTLNSGATTGSITTGTAALTLSATTGLYPGAMITIAGVTGTKTITALDYTTKIATLDSNADATVSGAAVAYKAPTFKTAGLIS